MDKLNNVQEKFESIVTKLKTSQSDKRILESKNLNTCSELKLPKSKKKNWPKRSRLLLLQSRMSKKERKQADMNK